MSDISIKIEIGENLAQLLKNMADVDPSQITAIIESFEKIFNNQKTYICQLCGAVHFVGQPCNYTREK